MQGKCFLLRFFKNLWDFCFGCKAFLRTLRKADRSPLYNFACPKPVYFAKCPYSFRKEYSFHIAKFSFYFVFSKFIPPRRFLNNNNYAQSFPFITAKYVYLPFVFGSIIQKVFSVYKTLRSVH